MYQLLRLSPCYYCFVTALLSRVCGSHTNFSRVGQLCTLGATFITTNHTDIGRDLLSIMYFHSNRSGPKQRQEFREQTPTSLAVYSPLIFPWSSMGWVVIVSSHNLDADQWTIIHFSPSWPLLSYRLDYALCIDSGTRFVVIVLSFARLLPSIRIRPWWLHISTLPQCLPWFVRR